MHFFEQDHALHIFAFIFLFHMERTPLSKLHHIIVLHCYLKQNREAIATRLDAIAIGSEAYALLDEPG